MAIMIWSSACATLVAEDKRTLMVTSTPPGAQITVNGMPIGMTPANVVVNDHKPQQIGITKAGFAPSGCFITTAIGGLWIVADIVLGVWPLVVDLATDDWSSLTSSRCHANLVPLQG
jgi:hypothetical protein